MMFCRVMNDGSPPEYSMSNMKACVSSCTTTCRRSSYEPANGSTTRFLSSSVKPPVEPSSISVVTLVCAKSLCR